MADYNSSLPVRTETAGDVIVKIADSLIPAQQTQVTAARELSVLATAQPGVDIGDVTVNNGAGAAAVNIQDGGNSITIDGTVTVSNLPATLDTDYGTVGANTLRTASQIGNATGAADFNAGATGAQTLRVEANQGAANATPWNQNISQYGGTSTTLGQKAMAASMPVVIASDQTTIPVSFASVGSPVNDYKDASAIAAGASDNHDYTVTAATTLHLTQVEAAGSGKAKMVIQIETGVATGVFTPHFAQFNSTAETNMTIVLTNPILVAAGVRVRVIMANRDLSAQDLYSTICGYEV